MKKVFWMLMMLTVTLGAAVAGDDKTPKGSEPGIQFTESSWKEVLKRAKAEKKVIFLDAYASWCGPCKLLQKKVFTQKEVGDYFNGKFINVKMDMEKGEGPALSQVYPLEAYPTLLFIDGNGRVLKKVIGYQSPENLLSIGKSVKASI
ncbi:Thioredoxin domain protein [Fibrisoma limi BUZ 3]|uniref:Thioredoxin domain protein n=1 Tax=Fibrisoma limi BUZ 3 TaxID=1185876 RepID=I2GCM4_9BACT|nr:thioredoxin fold domain-containing protein [Fibrisoma limi]CCH51648.1 Thioredoxin domain protein [Fibrisoma limi BUZ 3]